MSHLFLFPPLSVPGILIYGNNSCFFLLYLQNKPEWIDSVSLQHCTFHTSDVALSLL